MKNFIYDGTFDGLLTCIFKIYEEKAVDVNIQKQSKNQSILFNDNTIIITDETQANRVWTGLKNKLSPRGRSTIYYSFLSEQPQIENVILNYIKQVFSSSKNIESDFANPSVLKLSKTAKSVGREKHRMEAFVRFRLTKDEYYFASISPDFDVLPLISKHFKNRYADQKWIIYDIKRKYGLKYDLKTLDIISFEFCEDFDFTKTSTDFFTEGEKEFQKLWKDYFDSTNIKSRKNIQLHVKHVPKRYWKYLSEKNPLL
ncbi:TIGR03915 family putative DNA repair protein [Winogradskyella litorisediminis]|uniref:TIGR03915 family putative DNA repair protein n=1 Tax=Winogradskyella litorisediminis TaxID=1156618 RepID=A0ABW3N3E5_9FLAO